MRNMDMNQRGYTLIEVVVVAAIIGIMSALVLVSSAGARDARNVERASREVAATIRQAQSFALSGRSTTSTENNCWFAVAFTGVSTYNVNNVYRNGSGTCSLTGTVASYSLSNGVTVSGITVGGAPISPLATIAFNLPRGEAMYINGGAMVALTGTFRITLTRGSATQYICVSPAGRVLENGNNASCS